jgi:cold shock CspA family protein
MKSELQITFRNMQPAEEIKEWIRSEVAKLEKFYGPLMRCRVAIEVPHRHHRKGSPYHIRIDLAVPQGEIVLKRDANLGARVRHLGEQKIRKQTETNIPHKDLRKAITDTFKAAGRRLQDYARRQRGDIKRHAALPEGRVSKILRQEGYGFLTSADGREIYFHKNSVLHRAFARLRVGTPVRFMEEAGEKGPQATTVYIVLKKRLHPTFERYDSL